jgi:nucleoside-diphosphate-sugar epimerase
MGTHVLLEVARIRNIGRFIHISTDEVYGEVEKAAVSSHEKVHSFFRQIFLSNHYWRLPILTLHPKQQLKC